MNTAYTVLHLDRQRLATNSSRQSSAIETRGFSAIGEPNVAVCLLPGTEVAFEEEAECSHPFARLVPKLGFGKLGEKLARFRQVNADYPLASGEHRGEFTRAV